MSTMNTIAKMKTENKGRQIGPFSYSVNTMLILSICMLQRVIHGLADLANSANSIVTKTGDFRTAYQSRRRVPCNWGWADLRFAISFA